MFHYQLVQENTTLQAAAIPNSVLSEEDVSEINVKEWFKLSVMRKDLSRRNYYN